MTIDMALRLRLPSHSKLFSSLRPAATIHHEGTPFDPSTPATQMRAPTSRRKKALLIGIQYSTHRLQTVRLSKPHRDVNMIRNLLIQLFHYRPEDIIVMTDASGIAGHLRPTRDNIIHQMINLVLDPRDDDEFFLYYAGHAGQTDESSPGDERDHMDEYIVPVDAMDESTDEHLMGNVIPDNKLKEILVQPLTHADVKCQLIALMDSCTSGTLLDLAHDLCNKVVGLKSLFFRIVRSLLEISPEAKSIVRARITEWLKDPRHDCNRFCNRKLARVKANVICISACEDSQTLVETPMAKTLADMMDIYLRRHSRRPRLKNLNRYIHAEFKRNHRQLVEDYHQELKKFQRGKREAPPKEPPRRSEKPLISSMRPLRMGTTLKL